jgi:hypothetical protein
VCDDSAVRQLLTREGISHHLLEAVFVPFSNSQPHAV